MYSPQELIDFETDIAKCFNEKMIKAPVHLHNGNEKQLIEIFENIKRTDWVLSTWRSHYHCLLHGVPMPKLKQAILDGRSITLAFPEHRVLCSAIVAGILPIAVGLAMSIKLKQEQHTVYVFVGDMTSKTGTFQECVRYAANKELPIKFVIEDNGLSVCTNTLHTWGENMPITNVIRYAYTSKYPHAGAGERIQF